MHPRFHERECTMRGMTTFGIWASLYVGSVVALLFQIAGKPMSVAAIAGGAFLAMAVYVLHRISPEVNDAMQRRHLQALTHRRSMLFLFGLASAVACGMLYMVKPILLLLLPVGCIAVTLYGRKTLCYPIRNVIFLKPIAVGCSITLMAWVLTGTPFPPFGAVGLAIIVSADALLCDIQDVQYDKSCGCITLPANMHPLTIWLIVFLLNVDAACFLWFATGSTTGWIILLVLPTLYALRTFDLRMVVDLRLSIVAVIAWTI